VISPNFVCQAKSHHGTVNGKRITVQFHYQNLSQICLKPNHHGQVTLVYIGDTQGVDFTKLFFARQKVTIAQSLAKKLTVQFH